MAVTIRRNIKLTYPAIVEPISIVYGTNDTEIVIHVDDATITGYAAVARNLTGESRFEQAATVAGDTVTFTPPTGFFLRGRNKLQIELKNAAKAVYTFIVPVYCEENIMAEGTHEEAKSVESFANQAADSAAKAAKSESAAKSAQQAAETAQGKAESAKTAAEDAKTKAEAARDAANTAKTDATAAQTAAEKARDEAVKAKDAANTAKTGAESAKADAVAAKNAAVTAQGAAEDAQEAAEAARDTATTQAGNAAKSAQTATAQATTAATKAGEAAESATAASGSAAAAAKSQSAAATAQAAAEKAQKTAEGAASTATSKATAADASRQAAETAAGNAATAQTAAEAAQGKAEAANTAAGKAQKAAEAANTAAGKAQTAAEAANTAAGKAQTAAETAASTATTKASDASTSADKAAKSEAAALKAQQAAEGAQADVAANAKAAQTAATGAAASKTAAEAANTAAGKAQTAAETASAAAKTAQTAAETAKGKAETAASTATTKANAAATSATSAENYAKQAQSYAVGTGGARPDTEATDSAKYYYEQALRVAQGLEGSLLPMGTIKFADLASKPKEPGHMYNISDAFTSDANFEDGGSHYYGAGANVYCTAGGKWDVMAAVTVTGVKGGAEETYHQGNVNITKDNIGLGNVENVSVNNQAPTFTQAASRENIVSGNTLTVILGKIMKWFADLKDAAFKKVANNLTTTTDDSVLDARQGKVLNEAIGGKVSKSGDTMTGSLTVNGSVTASGGFKGNLTGTADSANKLNPACVTNAEQGKGGYFKVATIKITTEYADEPLCFLVSERRLQCLALLTIKFSGGNTLDPALSIFTAVNDSPSLFALNKSAASTWDLYVQKKDLYDTATIITPIGGSYVMSHCSITYSNTFTATLPGTAQRATAATLYGKAQSVLNALTIAGKTYDGSQAVTVGAMTGATSSAAGTSGLVPAPTAGKQAQFLRGDGTWATPPDTNTTYPTFSGTTTPGLVPARSGSTTTKYLREDGQWQIPPDTNTTYSTYNGNGAGLVPAKGSATAGQYLHSDGTWQTPPDTNTTYTNFAAGKAGLVPGPTASSTTQYLRADGTWQVPPDTNTTYSAYTGSAAGLVPAKGEAASTAYLCSDGSWKTPPDTNTTYSNFTKSTADAAGKAGLVPAPAAGAGTTKYLREDGSWQVPPDTNTTYSTMVGATATKIGSAGLVPVPQPEGYNTKYLRADGRWETPPDTNTTYTAYSSTPQMDGTGAAGSSSYYARGDHRHPTDTSRAPKNHAATGTDYGVGNSYQYGHLKLSDAISSTYSTSGGTAATPKAIKDAVDSLMPKFCKVTGNTASATAGTSVTQVTLANMTYNVGGLFSISSGGVKVSKAGYYKAYGSCVIKSAANSNMVGTYIKYGTSYSSATEAAVQMNVMETNAPAAQQILETAPVILKLAAGDIIFLCARCSAAAGTVVPNAPQTWLQVEWLCA